MSYKGHHCAYAAHYHVVFPVKYRKALLDNHVTRAIKEITQAVEESTSFTLNKFGVMKTISIYLFRSTLKSPYPNLFKSSKVSQHNSFSYDFRNCGKISEEVSSGLTDTTQQQYQNVGTSNE